MIFTLTQTDPTGHTVTSTRDAVGRLTAVDLTFPAGTTHAIASAITSRADGVRTAATFGNGLTETRTSDLQGRLTQQTLGAIDTRTYSYDPAGNVTQLTELLTTTYSYDALHRLLAEQSPAVSQTFTYDAAGNRLSDGTTTATYVSQANRLATLDGVTVPHDAAGNRTAYGAQTLAYDQPGRLATVTELVGGTPVTVAQSVYDARGQRRVRTLLFETLTGHLGQRRPVRLVARDRRVCLTAHVTLRFVSERAVEYPESILIHGSCRPTTVLNRRARPLCSSINSTTAWGVGSSSRGQ